MLFLLIYLRRTKKKSDKKEIPEKREKQKKKDYLGLKFSLFPGALLVLATALVTHTTLLSTNNNYA